LLFAACGRDKHYDHDLYFCGLFAKKVLVKAVDEKRDTISLSDFSTREVRDLIYSTPDFSASLFLILKNPWAPSRDANKIVIFCTVPRLVNGKTLYAVGYADGSAGWEGEEFLGHLKADDIWILPFIN